MATPKGKAAKQTRRKVPPPSDFLHACEILTSAPGLGAVDSLPRGLAVVETPSGHPGWMKQKSSFSFQLLPYHRPLRDALVAAQRLHPLLTGASPSGDALGPAFSGLPAEGWGAAAKRASPWHQLGVPHGAGAARSRTVPPIFCWEGKRTDFEK